MPTVKLADSHSNIHTIHLPSDFTAKLLAGQCLTFSLRITEQWNELNSRLLVPGMSDLSLTL